MPIGNIRWYDKTRGFGFVSNPDGEDVYVGHAVLPEGVEELHKGQRIEYDFADGRPGPQALRVTILDEAPRAARPARRHDPAELNGMISDMITMLETTVQRDLRAGRHPERRQGRRMAEVLRAVARELDR
ncbi:cold-shock protein [Corynebacterium sphenisci DSM 44792]|uniref:Cold-shock protein n=1 Tax=Corynebacterium sphenisci DSM 44792 TaxID=1437874 RepID=A0A1L7CZI0_9CORY|nr:cold shock domain-containing protein [Corynebacterium sphenisci]APT91258.1 cold-shock protein [Corynebacterium sphenisci DSM 44792]